MVVDGGGAAKLGMGDGAAVMKIGLWIGILLSHLLNAAVSVGDERFSWCFECCVG